MRLSSSQALGSWGEGLCRLFLRGDVASRSVARAVSRPAPRPGSPLRGSLADRTGPAGLTGWLDWLDWAQTDSQPAGGRGRRCGSRAGPRCGAPRARTPRGSTRPHPGRPGKSLAYHAPRGPLLTLLHTAPPRPGTTPIRCLACHAARMDLPAAAQLDACRLGVWVLLLRPVARIPPLLQFEAHPAVAPVPGDRVQLRIVGLPR